MSLFWRNWLHIWCVSGGLFGLILASAAFESTSTLPHLYFQIIGSPEGFSDVADTRFALVVLGGVMVGWSLTLWTAIEAAFRLDDKDAMTIWNLLTFSMLTWFAIDSTLSVYTGFWRNAVVNALFLAAFLIPVIKAGVLKRDAGSAQPQTGQSADLP